MWVFDATPLIYLAKVDRLDLVDTLDQQCVVPELVCEEVVEDGLDEGYPDARRIEHAVENGLLEVIDVEQTELFDRLRANENLSDADVAVLICAAAHDGVAVMDEAYGRDVADVEGITTRGTAYLVLSLAKSGAIDVSEARSTIDAMVEKGWYCSPSVYTKIVQKLDSIDD